MGFAHEIDEGAVVELATGQVYADAYVKPSILEARGQSGGRQYEPAVKSLAFFGLDQKRMEMFEFQKSVIRVLPTG